MTVRLRPAQDQLQFVIEADTDLERLALRVFLKQTRQEDQQLWIHGSTYDGNEFGPKTFNFGTITKPSSLPTTTPDNSASDASG